MAAPANRIDFIGIILSLFSPRSAVRAGQRTGRIKPAFRRWRWTVAMAPSDDAQM